MGDLGGVGNLGTAVYDIGVGDLGVVDLVGAEFGSGLALRREVAKPSLRRRGTAIVGSVSLILKLT